MSLFPAHFGARKRPDEEPAPEVEPDNESRADVFNLIPPRATEKYERPKDAATTGEAAQPAVQPEGRNEHPVAAMDLTRLSIDNGGRLYWDGKPVEVKRRLMLSRRQAVGAGVVVFFVMVAAISSAIQATATLSDWACRAGMKECAAPTASPPAARPDIPL